MIGLMGNMMGMGWKRGQEVVVIVGTIGKALGMDSGCIGFTQVMFMLANGQMGRVMGVEFIPARMVVDMLENSSGVSSMDSATTISGNFRDGFPH